ncbi:MAG: tRNA lysidine(34) synthetase TilS [Acetobacteraceae bacterium]|jgi:tRNA(Ile)-lysidine synthase
MAPLGPFEPAPLLAAGVSGGADSMALALLADAWARARGGSLLALVVDHGLRPEAAAEAALTVQRLAGCGIPARTLRLAGLHRGPALAERARAARYAALRAACAGHGILHLLLGHHAADQAETVLMRRQSGSGPAGLAAMPALSEQTELRLLRPLLGVPPVRLRATLLAAGVAWVEDPSNRDQRALRSRLRAGLGDPDGTGPAIAALCEAARAAGTTRAAREAAIAEILAERAAIHPEGFALLSPGPIEAAALAALIQTIAGAAFPPPTRAVTALAAAPRPATLAGVRLLPAGRLGDGLLPLGEAAGKGPLLLVREAAGKGPLLLVREAAAMAPVVAARPGAVWDGRFRLAERAMPPEDATIGALGADAARLRRWSRLPSAVLQTLPALRRGNSLVAVPHLLYPDRATCDAVPVVFSPRRPAAGAPFLPVPEPGGNVG